MGHFFRHKKYQKPDINLHKKNEEIRVPLFTLVLDDGEKIENCSRENALKIAHEKDLDLVLVSPSSNPPVAKLMDWGKYKYESLKKKQINKKTQKINETKEIRFRPKTGKHDLDIKVKKIREFLEKGYKAKLVMMFKGREAMYLDKSKEDFQNIINSLSDISRVDDSISYQFRKLSVTISPIIKV